MGFEAQSLNFHPRVGNVAARQPKRRRLMEKHSPRPNPIRRQSNRLLAGVAGAALAVGGFGVSATAAAASTSTDQVINIALTSDVDSVNPFIGVLADAMHIHRIQYEPLVAWGPEDNAEHPALAQEWQSNDDGTTWTYKLEEGAKWSDGETITSEDVEWTYNAILENESLSSAFGAYASNVENVAAVDDYTVEIQLSEPQSANPGTDIPIVPEHVWSTIDDPAAHPNDKDVVGSGPFQVTSYSVSSGIQMTANPHYRGGEPAFGGINFVPYKNTDAAVQALKAGEIDMISGLTTAQYEALQKDEKIEVVAASGRGFRGVQINPGATDINGNPMGDGHEVLHDVKFRQALVHAIDRDSLNERVLKGYGTTGTGLIPPLYPNFYVEPGTSGLLEFDLDKANQLLDEAGYQRGADGVRTDHDGNPIKLRVYSYEHASAQQTIDLIAGGLDEIGIKTELNVTSMGQYNDDTVMGNYDIYVSGWTVRPNPDYLFGMNTCDSRPAADGSGATSLAGYCNEEFDKLYAQQASETDPDARAELMKQMQLDIEQAAIFPVFFYPDTFQAYRSDKLENVVPQPAEGGAILMQNGAWSLAAAKPVGGGDGGAAGGNSTGIWIGAGAAVAVIAGLLFLNSRRKKASAEERE